MNFPHQMSLARALVLSHFSGERVACLSCTSYSMESLQTVMRKAATSLDFIRSQMIAMGETL
jgi:hypothetical protein